MYDVVVTSTSVSSHAGTMAASPECTTRSARCTALICVTTPAASSQTIVLGRAITHGSDEPRTSASASCFDCSYALTNPASASCTSSTMSPVCAPATNAVLTYVNRSSSHSLESATRFAVPCVLLARATLSGFENVVSAAQ